MNPQVKFVQAKTTTLQAPISSTEISEIPLTQLVDIYGNQLTMADFGDIMYVTTDPGTDQEEIISATDFTVNADGSVSVDTGIVRGLAAVSPYGAGGTASAHSAGATVIISNNPQIYNSLVSLTGDQTVEGIKTFSVPPQTPSDPTGNDDLTRKSYVLGLVLGTLTTIDVIVPGTAGATIAAGQGVYFDTGTNTWKLWNAGTAATVNEVLLGIAQGAGTASNPIVNGVLLQGVDTNQTGLTPGVVYYAGNTNGSISTTPGTNTVTVGIAKDATSLYFDPRFNQQLTQNQLDALAGTSGTAPSGANKFVDAADVSNAGVSGKIVRLNGTTYPAGDGSGLTNVPTGFIKQILTAGQTLAAGQAVNLLPFPAADIAFDAKTAINFSSTGNTSTFAVANNNNRFLIVATSNITGGKSVSAITYNGVGLTRLVHQTGVGTVLDLWYLVAPATGSNSLVFTMSASDTCYASVYSYYNCAQQAPEADTAVQSIAGGPANAIVTPLTNGALVFGLSNISVTGGTAAANNVQNNSSQLYTSDSGPIYPPSAQNLVTSDPGAGNIGAIVASIAPVAAGSVARVYKASSAVAINTNGLVGFADGAATVGNTVSVCLGGVEVNLSGLTVGAFYYLNDTPGTIGISAGTVSRKIGIAISATQLLITNIW